MLYYCPSMFSTSLPCVFAASHRNTVVRNAASRLVASVAATLGVGHVLSGIKDVTDRILCTATEYMLDSSPDTRYSMAWHTLLLLLLSAVTHAPFHAPVLRPTSWHNARDRRDGEVN